MTSSSTLKSKLKSVTNGRKYITSLLKRYSEGDLVEDGEIMDLLAFHPTKKLDKTNVEYLIMRNRNGREQRRCRRKPIAKAIIHLLCFTSTKQVQISMTFLMFHVLMEHKKFIWQI